ncbi:FAD/NAD(P)-binding protein [Rhodocytophaga aerolata]|uniref:FAD/NAD(P)-binding protein n=1 Tax=Rhodocytophaga aerolata TaxID=455078 RepID=A0ABT8RB51_9BACT|nr:FAD/NAD(P)-binding protein [Rhodocytophaga aerolata]MDO1449324.1 FAD/NAD(P)-binding protein [Rhodocytophaga aerolata]
MKSTTLAIVGGGANGVASLVHLVLKLLIEPAPTPVSITLFEKKEEVGPGLAYDTSQKGHLLNTSAGLMGIFAFEPMHFVEWLQTHKSNVQQQYPQAVIHPDAYLPRQLYGQYLKDVVAEYTQLASRHNIQVELCHDEVVDAEIREGKVDLFLKSGETLETDVTILATGTPKPNNFRHLEASPAYVDFPWPSSRLIRDIPADAPVAILGTSLTAIDTLMTFMDNGHTGKLTLYSRHGLLPRIQTPFDVDFERKILTMENIRKIIREQKRTLRAKDLIRLFRAEAERVMGKQTDWKKFDRIGKDPLALLKYDLEVALEGKSEFQNILYATRYLSFEIWKLLPTDQKILFSKWVGHYFDINRHCIPPENGRKLIRLLESGQLTVKGHSEKVEWEAKEQLFQLRMANGKTDKVPYLVNATGTARDITYMRIPLLEQLLKKNLLIPYKPGGIRADTYTLQVHVPGHPDAPLYGTGQLLVGELFDTNAVWFNVTCIDRMASAITNRICHGRTR